MSSKSDSDDSDPYKLVYDDSLDDCYVTSDNESDVSFFEDKSENVLLLHGVQVDQKKYASLQQNAAKIKGTAERLLPKPIVLHVGVNGSFTRALVDSGSLGDFVSSTLVDQLRIKRTLLEKSIGLQLAVQGSRSRVNASVEVHLTYLGIDEIRHFNVANLNDYDIILGTPWIYQHQVCIGLNPSRIVIGSDVALPITTGDDTKPLLNIISPKIDEITAAHDELMAYAKPLC